MKIIVHDYAGHPFQVHLSRQLALRGHEVTHIYFVDNHGPKGSFTRGPTDPVSLNFVGITMGWKVSQTALISRRFHDVAYGKEVAHVIRKLRPEVLLCGNTPVESQRAIMAACKAESTRFVYWVQDVYGVAMTKLLTKRLGTTGKLAGGYFQWLDHQQFRHSDAIIVITDGFLPEVTPWAGPGKVTVIENWASLEEIVVGEKNNSWSRQHHLDNDFTFLYSGTLGRKHNAMLLLKLAQKCISQQSMVIVGQGFGKDQLEAVVDRPKALKLLPLQSVERFSDVLATADVLVATIESDAGKFAVPSKIQSYLCAGRPILLAAPKDNLAARTVMHANGGIVVDPTDEAGFLAAAELLATDPHLRAQFGRNGRAYAERTFDIERITDRFERILDQRPQMVQQLDRRPADVAMNIKGPSREPLY
jgi:colanic acid biosynthesis glycosyl transferase WcaI